MNFLTKLSSIWPKIKLKHITIFQIKFVHCISYKVSPFQVSLNSTTDQEYIKSSNKLTFTIVSIICSICHIYRLSSLYHQIQSPNVPKKGALITKFLIYLMALICSLYPLAHLSIRGSQQIALFNRLNNFKSKVNLGTLDKTLIKLVCLQGPIVGITSVIAGGIIFWMDDYFGVGLLFGIFQWWNFVYSFTLGGTIGIFGLFGGYAAVFVGAQNVLR